MTDQTQTTAWPTLGQNAKVWDARCAHCDNVFPPDTRIMAVWSPRLIYVACPCSPRLFVPLELSGTEHAD